VDVAARLTRTLAETASRAAQDHSGHPRILADARRTGTGLVVWALLKDQSGAPRAVYGLAADRTLFRDVLERSCSDEPLLPPSIAGDQPNDSLLYISVIAPDGGTIYESPVSYPERFAADDTLGDRLGGLVARATVRPDAAGRLVIGGLPGSRLPLILGLLLLAAGVGAASLVQLRRERELARLRDDFVSGVSHELRTPLAQIQMFAELLDDEKLRTDDERRRSTRILRQESRRLNHLIENVLQFSRSRRLPPRLALTEVDVGTAIADTVESFRPLADAREVELATEVAGGLTVRADAAVLRQMLVNLLDNAVKYGPRGQTVRVGARRENGVVRIRVSDEGPGVPASDRGRVWEPYHRLERDANGPVGGSGIGLAVVRELTLRQGGAVTVEDAAGGGAEFVIELPAAPATEPDRAEAGKRLEAGNGTEAGCGAEGGNGTG
jgi:signal transduction histidine kinase